MRTSPEILEEPSYRFQVRVFPTILVTAYLDDANPRRAP